MQAMKNLWTWAAVGLVGYLVWKQYQQKNALPTVTPTTLPEAQAQKTSL